MTEAQANRRAKRIFGKDGRALIFSGIYYIGVWRATYYEVHFVGDSWEDAFERMTQQVAPPYLQSDLAHSAKCMRWLSRHYGVTKETRRAAAVAATKLSHIVIPKVP